MAEIQLRGLGEAGQVEPGHLLGAGRDSRGGREPAGAGRAYALDRTRIRGGGPMEAAAARRLATAALRPSGTGQPFKAQLPVHFPRV